MVDCSMKGQAAFWQQVGWAVLQGLGAASLLGLMSGCQPAKKSPVAPSAEASAQASQPYASTQARTQRATQDVSATASVASTPPAPPVTLTIAASTNLNSTLPVMVDDFNHLNPDIDLKVIYDTSDRLVARIRQHNAFDVFLTTSQIYTQDLYADSQQRKYGTRYGQPFIYARGQLVLYSSKHTLTTTPTQLLDDLLLEHAPITMALSDPEVSPYGEAAQAWLVNQNFTNPAQIQLRPYANLLQTFAATDSAQVDFGFVSLSQVLNKARDNTVREATKSHSYALLSKADYPPILQEGMVLKPSAASQQFVGYLLSPRGQLLLAEAGYLPVCGDNSLKLPACS